MFRYWKTIVHRANRETLSVIGFDRSRRHIGLSIVTFIVALFVVRFLGGGEQITEEMRWGVAALIAVGVVYLPIFFCKLAKLPAKLNKELEDNHRKQGVERKKEIKQLKNRVQVLEEERIPRFEITPITGKPPNKYESGPVAFAELKIKNTSPSETLVNVSVQIMKRIGIFRIEEQEAYFAYDEGNWTPASVYWSERNAQAKQLLLSIPPTGSRNALIAFRYSGNVHLGIFNTPTTPVFGCGEMIEIEVSSNNSASSTSKYYIEYHPPASDKYEFVEWDEWLTTHKLIDRPIPDKEGSQT